MVKKIPADKARKTASKPRANMGQTLTSRSKTGAKEYLILQGPKEDMFTLWLKEGKGYLEVATAGNPNELEDVIDWEA